MKSEKSTILLVEDHVINRRIVSKILSSEYKIQEAENGQIALELLKKDNGEYAAILLDIVMPVMDGFEFLKEVSETEYAQIPIIVMTGDHNPDNEKKVIELGAWDFVVKPVQPETLKSRLRNVIARSQIVLMEKIRQLSSHDGLTGLYNRSEFFTKTRKLLENNLNEDFCFVRMDVDKFRLFNTALGDDTGDKLLCYLADIIRNAFEKRKKCTFGRIDSDVFCICVPYDKDTIEKELLEMQKKVDTSFNYYRIKLSFGIYIINDRNLSPETMLTCSAMAAEKCKHKYDVSFAYYVKKMSEKALIEQRIANEMNQALDEEQFLVYLQPKYDLKTEQPSGAEALVRWNHPEKGIVPPSVFIPFFEQNGFIKKLDYYMWEHVCALLSKWKKEGINVYPVSVNMSRVSLFNPNVVETLLDLIKKYDLTTELLNLEVTESAYMSNPTLMENIIARLRSNGFSILMDDFGSEYSSLNTLKEIEVDVLKIDMKFLPTKKENHKGKAEKILSSMVRMSGWLGMPVIAEGVETAEQKEFLSSIGCGYVQGYYYAKPMPVEDYEKLIKESNSKEHDLNNNISQINNNFVWSSNSQFEDVMKIISVPIGIYEYCNNNLETVRVNKAYLNEDLPIDLLDVSKHHLSYDYEIKVLEAFDNVYNDNISTQVEFYVISENGETNWYQLRLQLIDQISNSSLVSGSFLNITEQKNAENKLFDLVAFYKEGEKKNKMLIIDDQEISRVVLREMFDGHFNILEASEGQEALQIIEKYYESISIILLDMIMPGIDGEQFLRKKIALEKGKDIPVIVISSESEVELQKKMLELGVNDYITKPFIPEKTKRRVQNVLEYSSRFKRLVEEFRKM